MSNCPCWGRVRYAPVVFEMFSWNKVSQFSVVGSNVIRYALGKLRCSFKRSVVFIEGTCRPDLMQGGRSCSCAAINFGSVAETLKCLGRHVTHSFQSSVTFNTKHKHRLSHLPSPPLCWPFTYSIYPHASISIYLRPPYSHTLIASMMIIRFQSRNGQFRLNLEPNTQISTILPEVLEKLPSDVIPSSVTISPKPAGAEARSLESLKDVSFARLGLTCVFPRD